MAVTFYPNYINYVGFDAAAEPSCASNEFTSSGGETTGALYDLVDSKRDNVVTFDTSGETTDAEIDIDSNGTHSSDFYILDNHNLNTAGANIKMQVGGEMVLTDINISSAYEGSLGSELSAIEDVSNEEIPTPQDGILLALYEEASNLQDYQWVMYEDGANFTADITIGELFIGKKLATAYQPEIGILKSSRFGTNVLQSKGGHKYGFKNYGEARRWQLNWIYVSDAEKTNFETLWAVTEGQRYPFYIDLGENTNPTLYLVRFAMPELRFTELPGAWQLSITIEEEI